MKEKGEKYMYIIKRSRSRWTWNLEHLLMDVCMYLTCTYTKLIQKLNKILINRDTLSCVNSKKRVIIFLPSYFNSIKLLIVI